jgi:hypothetical protein
MTQIVAPRNSLVDVEKKKYLLSGSPNVSQNS